MTLVELIRNLAYVGVAVGAVLLILGIVGLVGLVVRDADEYEPIGSASPSPLRRSPFASATSDDGDIDAGAAHGGPPNTPGDRRA